MLTDPEINQRMAAGGSLEDICRALVHDANVRGGVDNTTVEDAEAEPPTLIPEVAERRDAHAAGAAGATGVS